MLQYYITRISFLVLFICCMFWGINFFREIPLTRTYQGEVVHTEIVKTDTIRHNSFNEIVEYTNITVITPSGKTKTWNSYKLDSHDIGAFQYDMVYDHGKFYTVNLCVLCLIIFSTAFSFFIVMGTCMTDSLECVESFFDQRDEIGRSKMRRMRIDHAVFMNSFFGIDPDIDKDIYRNAIEAYKEKSGRNFSGVIKIPKYSEVIDGIQHEYERLLELKS